MRTGKEKSSKTLTIYLKMRHVCILQYYVEWRWIPKYKICKKTSSFVMTTCRKNKFCLKIFCSPSLKAGIVQWVGGWNEVVKIQLMC